MGFEEVSNALFLSAPLGRPLSLEERLRLAWELGAARSAQRGLEERAKEIAAWEKRLFQPNGIAAEATAWNTNTSREIIEGDDARLVRWHEANRAKCEHAKYAQLLDVDTNMCLIIRGIEGALVTSMPYWMKGANEWTGVYADRRGHMGKIYAFPEARRGPGVNLGTGLYKIVIDSITADDLWRMNDALYQLEASGMYYREDN